MAGGKRGGAGRKPVSDQKRKVSVTVSLNPEHIKWVRETKRKGWLSKMLSKTIDSEMKVDNGNI